MGREELNGKSMKKQNTTTGENSPCIPVRHVVAVLGFFGLCNAGALTASIDVAIVAMVSAPVGEVDEFSEELTCPELISSDSTSPQNSTTLLELEFNWDSTMQGLVLGSFFYGCFLSPFPGGVLAERIGAKWVYGCGIMISAVLSLLIPVAARWSVWALIAVRAVQGFAEGAAYPAVSVLVSRWAPISERSRFSATINIGYNMGIVLAMAITGAITHQDNNWPASFYLFGSLGCVWFLVWALVVHEFPKEHPRISDAELRLILQGQENNRASKRPTPWKSILTSTPVWGLIFTHFGILWGYYTLLTNTPTYLANVLHYDLLQNGILSAAPHLVLAFLSIAVCACADKVREKKILEVVLLRKICNSIAFYGQGVCLMVVAYAGCRPMLIVSMLTLAISLVSFVYCGVFITHVDMSPNFAGTLMGMTNGFANLAGILAPSYVGWAVQSGQTVENWRTVFVTSAAVFFVTGTIYNIFCSAKLQAWDSSPQSAQDKAKDEVQMQCQEL